LNLADIKTIPLEVLHIQLQYTHIPSKPELQSPYTIRALVSLKSHHK
ncbi:hypothetical protein JL09_g6318, partial [Pichia kudriavzevii]